MAVMYNEVWEEGKSDHHFGMRNSLLCPLPSHVCRAVPGNLGKILILLFIQPPCRVLVLSGEAPLRLLLALPMAPWSPLLCLFRAPEEELILGMQV